MREIKFRGYCEDTNEWVYGGLIHITVDYVEEENVYHIERDDYYIVDEEGTQFHITNKKSIGQYTGLKDKNGVDIYEGDIVKIPDDYEEYGFNAGEKYEIYFKFGGFRLRPKRNLDNKGYWVEDDNELELIGNIHDNPELLEEE